MNVLIKLTTAGVDTGPFDLYSNSDGYQVPFASGIAKVTLEAGYLATNVPNDAVTVRVTSDGICTNYVNLQIGTTTTTTSTAPPTPREWYRVVNCNTQAVSYTTSYTPNTFEINSRVIYQTYPYVINGIYSVNPGGTQITVTASGETGCPPLGEYYTLVNCETSATANSELYPVGSFTVNERVTVTDNVYRITGVVGSPPAGTLLNIVTTGQIGCPTVLYTQYTSCSNPNDKLNILGSGYPTLISYLNNCYFLNGPTYVPRGTTVTTYGVGCTC
jgi:hypothetical protein